jgi:hypothetical protein
MKRRDFFKYTAAGAALAAAPAIIQATDKSGARNAVIGTGDYRY